MQDLLGMDEYWTCSWPFSGAQALFRKPRLLAGEFLYLLGAQGNIPALSFIKGVGVRRKFGEIFIVQGS